jgi:serine phosphatase RsbU (regulator of sigma subunit)
MLATAGRSWKLRRRIEMVDQSLTGDTFANVPLFQELPAPEVERLTDELRLVRLAPGEILFREGDPGDRFYVLAAGEVEIYQALGRSEERIIAVRSTGDFIGELSLLNRDGLRTAGVRAREAVQLWEMRHSQFDALIQRQPTLAYELARVLSARLTAAQTETIRDLTEKNEELIRAYEELKAAQAQIIEKERLERELQLAHDIQMSILPRSLPQFAGYDFGAYIAPARFVGGDFYDMVALDADRAAIIVGDVSGKGVPAAIFMAQIHSLLHAASGLFSQPCDALQWVNRQLHAMGEVSLFATVLYGVLDRRTSQFTFARAGHERPILSQAGTDPVQADWGLGQPLGLLEDPVLDEQRIDIPRGSMLLIYSDGVTDSRNPDGQVYGLEMLLEKLNSLMGSPAQQLCDDLWQTLVAFQGSGQQFDDVTLFAVCSD